MTLQQDVSKVSLYNLGYICTLLESLICTLLESLICTLLELLFYSESNGLLFNFVGQRN